MFYFDSILLIFIKKMRRKFPNIIFKQLNLKALKSHESISLKKLEYGH